jgi:hypothetical protein
MGTAESSTLKSKTPFYTEMDTLSEIRRLNSGMMRMNYHILEESFGTNNQRRNMHGILTSKKEYVVCEDIPFPFQEDITR